ncbi:hypothetical protein KPL33_11595 [Clostridium algidicarnis]|uniref:UDP-3-O-(3-hydroxymyristoyl)glucosamine N-acyltransferase n=1 Tax=Clostridium algidicarnis TaxID=37659 RepID=UPI001C0D4034|nr:UDP-3-O-(3-hydroxymyristoyl)glucosamine N-acyltransferase [Clostridium algidicarnis]MBU3207620.1 hypothetical protein [Clostridium algidicarnis]
MLKIDEIKSYLDSNQVNYTFRGKDNLTILNYCPLNMLKDNCITWVRDTNNYDISIFDNYENLLVVCNNDVQMNEKSRVNYIFTDNPHSIYFSLLNNFFNKNQQENETNIYNNSIVETEKIGKNVQIGHFCYIGKEVVIEDNVVIKNNVSIEGKVKIGKDTVIYAGVVIGMDGYGYYDDINNNHVRVPHLGGVIIGDNVEIGSNTCIAKGCLGDTIINDDVKIDNLCHIAHNVMIGKRSKIIALTMLGGSSIIGEDVWVAPCSAVKNQVLVGNDSLVGMGAVVTKNVESSTIVAGVPAKLLKNK